jgi:hypothetical protein
MTDQEVEQIKVSIPHAGSGERWLFVSRRDAQRWHPWWGELFSLLLTIRPRNAAGTDTHGSLMEVSTLQGEARKQFVAFVQTAPASEVAEHRTLRSVPRIAAETEREIEVRFFGAAPESAQDPEQDPARGSRP